MTWTTSTHALDFSDDSETARARRTGWLQAVQFGFHQGPSSDEYEKLWLDHVEADDVECRGVWLPEGCVRRRAGAGRDDVVVRQDPQLRPRACCRSG